MVMNFSSRQGECVGKHLSGFRAICHKRKQLYSKGITDRLKLFQLSNDKQWFHQYPPCNFSFIIM